MISWNAVLAIAYKEFVHVWRDRRVVLLIVVLPDQVLLFASTSAPLPVFKRLPEPWSLLLNVSDVPPTRCEGATKR